MRAFSLFNLDFISGNFFRIASKADLLRSSFDLKFMVLRDMSRGLPSPFGLLYPNGTVVILVPFATAIAQNHMSSAVGAIEVNVALSFTVSLSECAGYNTPPTPVWRFLKLL